MCDTPERSLLQTLDELLKTHSKAKTTNSRAAAAERAATSAQRQSAATQKAGIVMQAEATTSNKFKSPRGGGGNVRAGADRNDTYKRSFSNQSGANGKQLLDQSRHLCQITLL